MYHARGGFQSYLFFLAKGHSVGLSGCFDERIVYDIKSSNYCTDDKVSKAYARLVFIHNVILLYYFFHRRLYNLV